MGLVLLAIAAPLYFLTRSEPPPPHVAASERGSGSDHPSPPPTPPPPPPPQPAADAEVAEATEPADAAEPPPPATDAGPRPPAPSRGEFMDACRSGNAAKIHQILDAAPAGQRRFLIMQCRRLGADLAAQGAPSDAGTDATP